MAKNLLSKYVWLVDTIYKARRISLADIKQKWLDDEMDYDEKEGKVKELSTRTFHKWRITIEEMFGLCIANEDKGQYRYYIENEEELSNGKLRGWLFNTLAVSNLLLDHVSIKEKILVEEIPAGQDYLPAILEALKDNTQLYITYQSYFRNEESSFYVEPYCLKAFKQRWYLVAYSPHYHAVMIYSLDRIHALQPTNKQFTVPADFQPDHFFDKSFGIIVNDDCGIETVRLKVCARQSNYLRDLKLHKSQIEVERNDDFSIFEIRLRPTFDFQQELLSMGDDIEVLEPLWLRKEIAGKVKRMWNKYKDEL